MEWSDRYYTSDTMSGYAPYQKEEFGHLKGLKVAYLGDGRNNVANSLLVGCSQNRE